MPVAHVTEGVQVGNSSAAPQLIVEDLKEMEKGSRMDEEGGMEGGEGWRLAYLESG